MERINESVNKSVYVIYSRWILNDIRELLSSYTEPSRIGLMHVDRDRDGRETNRTLCLLDESVFEALVKDGYDKNPEFSIRKYVLRPNSYPPRGRSYSFFIPLPRTFSLSEEEVRRQIEEKMQQLVKFSILADGDYMIKVLQSGEKTSSGGSGRRFCFISFKKEVTHDAIALAKVAIDNTWWFLETDPNNRQRELFKCYWSRKRKIVRDSDGVNPPISRSSKNYRYRNKIRSESAQTLPLEERPSQHFMREGEWNSSDTK
jgi:hypothetical protein